MKTAKLLALLLAVCLCLGLFAGCGNSAASAAPAASAEASAETPAADEAPADEPAAPAVEPGPDAEVVAMDSGMEGTDGQTVAITKGDPNEAMAEEYISYPLDGDNSISIWYYIPGYQDFMDSNYSYNAIPTAEAATGVKLEFTEVSASSASEQFNLMVAGGDMTDLIPCLEYYTGGLSKAYDEDIIVDIEPYIEEYMPNYAAVRDCLADSTVNATYTDGMTLAFYQIKDGTYSGNGLVSRADWIAEQGWEWSGDLISLEEFDEYLHLMKDAYDVPYPIYMYDGTVGVEAAFDTEIPVLVGDGFMTSVNSAIFRYDDEVTSGWITDGYRSYLEWVLKEMEDGIIPKDYLSLDTDRGVTNTMQAAGSILVWTSNADKLEEIVDTYGANYPGLAVTGIPQVTADPSETYVWKAEESLVSTRGGFSLSANCTQPELVCQWENFFWTTDGYMIANYGTEGESYHYEADGSPLFDWQNPVTVTGRNAPNAEMATALFTMGRFAGCYQDNDILLPTFPQSALDAVALWTIDGAVDQRNFPSAVTNGMTVEETQELSAIENDFLTYADETCMKFLSGDIELNDDTWNDYLAKCDQMGINDIIAIYQTAYNEYQAGER